MTSPLSLSFLSPLLRALDGAAVTIVTGAGATVSPPSDVDTVFTSMVREPSLWNDLLALFQVWRLLVHSRPIATIAATPKAGLITTLAARLAGVPVRLYWVWGLRLETTRGPRRVVLRLAEQLATLSATHVVCNSRSLAEAHKDEVGLKRRRDVIGHGSSHGVSLSRFERSASVLAAAEQLGQSKGRPFISFIGRVHEDKGLDTLMSLANRSKSEPWDLVVVGPPEAPAERIADLARAGAHVIGPISDVRPFLAASRLLVLPSAREGFPNVVLEAAAMSVPTVAYGVTGVKDAIVDGVTGCLVESGDSEEFVDAVCHLMDDDDRRGAMGGRAHQRVIAHFSEEFVVGETLKYIMAATHPYLDY